jgi:hypothetical protein
MSSLFRVVYIGTPRKLSRDGGWDSAATEAVDLYATNKGIVFEHDLVIEE